MLRAPARTVLLATVVLLLTGSGCAADRTPAAVEISADTGNIDCRAEWAALGSEIDGNQRLPEPSALASRWTSVVATVDYYATSAKESDCGEPLAAQKRAITALQALVVRLQPYDMELRITTVFAAAQRYATSPLPVAPSPSPATKGKKSKPQARPPKPVAVDAALRTLTEQAPLATEQQGPAWQQASVVDPSDTAAVLKAVKDLDFLSRESPAFVLCAQALETIRLAVAAGVPAS